MDQPAMDVKGARLRKRKNADEGPQRSSSSSMRDLSAPLRELMAQACDRDGRVVAPRNWRTWHSLLGQAVPALEAALQRTRPAAADAPVTPAERQAPGLLRMLHELDGMQPPVMSPRLLSDCARVRQDAARRLVAAALQPERVLADVPGLTRAAQACGDAGTAQVRAEALALRCGGARCKPEQLQLLMREWLTLEAQAPGRLIAPLQAFMRSCACFASQEEQEQFVGQCLQDCMREALKLQQPSEFQLARAELTSLQLLLQAVGQAFSGVPGLTRRSANVAFSPFIRRELQDPPPWLTDHSRALALCVKGVCRGLGAHGDPAESALLAESLLSSCIEYWRSTPIIHGVDASSLGGACSLLLRGTADRIAWHKAALLTQFAASRDAEDADVDERLKAMCLVGMCADPLTGQADPSRMLSTLACLPLAQSVDLLATLARCCAGLVPDLLRALACGTAGLESDNTIRLALAWGMANPEGGKAGLLAQFPSSLYEGPTAALCRQACRAALEPVRLLTLGGRSQAALSQLVPEAYQLLGRHRRLDPAGELKRILQMLALDSPARWRADRVSVICDLFVATSRRFARGDFVSAHMCVQRDMRVLMSRPDAEAGRRAMQAAGRFFNAIPVWVTGRLEHAGPDRQAQVEQCVRLQATLEELQAELACGPRSLLRLAQPALQGQIELLKAVASVGEHKGSASQAAAPDKR